MSRFFQDERIARQVAAIRNFCTTPAQQGGGMLLLSGPRGSGKTRLVDYALNDEQAGPSVKSFFFKLWAVLFGEDRRRKRQIILRQPRTTYRILLPVTVDPFFPHVEKDQTPEATGFYNRPDLYDDCDQDVLRLLKNILFGLTSTIDTRFSIRNSGRNLQATLGWVRTWFSLTGCYMPGVSDNRRTQQILKGIAVVALTGCAYCLAQLITTLLLETMALTDSVHTTQIGPHWVQYPVIVMISWLYLRWCDLRGIGSMSKRLYDLIHAQSFAQKHQLQSERRWQWQMYSRNLLLTVSLLMIAFGIVAATPIFGQMPDITPVLLLLGSGLFFWSSRLTKQVHTTFGQANRVWMITLLRRYLFLLHRCGLEPVLVLDELDKLDVESDLSEPSLQDPLQPATLKLLNALITLKQSLGAQFVWILIDTHYLYNFLIRQRTGAALIAPGWQGPVATLIHKELLVHPLSFTELNDYLNKHPDADYRGMSDTNDISRALFWLETQGLFSRIVSAPPPPHINPQLGSRALFLVHCIVATQHAIQNPDPEQFDVAEFTDADQVWIQNGLIDLAYKLLYNLVDDQTHQQQHDDEETGMDMSEPRNLVQHGRNELRAFLERLYRHGGTVDVDDEPFEPAQCGLKSVDESSPYSLPPVLEVPKDYGVKS
jgi:hypothetical protein